MAVLDNYRKDTVGSEESLFFLEVPDSGSDDSKAYHMMFLRAESDTIDTGVETETISDVTQKTQPTEVKAYSPSLSLNSYFLKSDPVCKALQDVFDKRATGAAAHFNLLEVRTWDSNKAFRTDVTVAVSSIPNEAGDKRKIEATIGYAGDSEEGTASINAETGVATFTPA